MPPVEYTHHSAAGFSAVGVVWEGVGGRGGALGLTKFLSAR